MSKNKIYHIIFFVFILLVYPQNTFSKNIKKVEDLLKRNQQYHQVRKLMGEKKYKEAIIKCKGIIEKDITFIGIYPLLALSSGKLNKLDTTIGYFKQLIKKDPENPFFYYGLGQCYKKQGNFKKTRDIYKQAINLKTEIFYIYFELGNMAKTKKDRSDLIKYYEKKKRINPDNSFLYYGLGAINEYKLKNYDIAFRYYLQSLKTARSNGNKANEAKHLNTIGVYYWARSNFTKALEYFKLAAEAAHTAKDKTREARFLYNCGLIYCNLGNWLKAKKYYNQALKIDKEIGNKIHEAGMLRSIGFCCHRLSNYSQALNYYKLALRISQKFTDKDGESQYLADIGRVYWDRGHYSQAVAYQKEALIIAQEMGNKYNESTILDSIGSTYWKMGHLSKALEYYLRALKLSKNLGNKNLAANYLANIGNIYRQIGNYFKALENCKKALKVQREIGSKESEGVNLNNIGAIYFDLNNYSQSLKYYEQALEIAQELGERKAEAIRLINIAYTHLRLDNYSQALKCFKKSLKIAKEIGTKPTEAFVFLGLGDLFYKIKDYTKSSLAFRSALVLAQDLGLLWESWESLYGLALVYEKQEKYDEALTHYKRAIEFIEDVRSQFSMKEHKASFLKRNITVYESLIYLLYKLHQKQPLKRYDEEAFYYVEKAKARAFLDSLQEVKINLKESLSADLLYEENKISREISNIQTRLIEPRLPESERKKLFQKLEEKEENYFNLIQKIRKDNPEYANLVYPEPRKLEEIQEKLMEEETALIEYFIGDKNSLVFLITKNDFYIHKLPQSKELQERANDYIKLISAKSVKEFDSFAAGHKLYQQLIGSFRNKLISIKKLIIIPDRNLHYLPFETLVSQLLSSNPKFIVGDYKISYAPSASSLIHLLERRRISKIKKDLLAFADPVYTLAQGTGKEIEAGSIFREFCLQQGFVFHPLKYSGEEVKKIAKFFKGKLKEIYTQDKATEEKIKEITLKDYKIIHFATHGLLDEKVPMRSSLVLSLDQDPKEDGFYQVREIYNTKLNSDLVILSACQTGKGRLEKGEGVSGLSRAFLHAGAQSVLVSLWNINDKATSEFMGYFYKYLSQGESKEKALQLAKIKMVKSKYAHPFYWASFILIGDYQSPVKLTKPSFWEKIFWN